MDKFTINQFVIATQQVTSGLDKLRYSIWLAMLKDYKANRVQIIDEYEK